MNRLRAFCRPAEDSPPLWIAVLLLALVLASIAKEASGNNGPYVRPSWGVGATRGDDCDTRCEVLRERCSFVVANIEGGKVAGVILRCRDAYAGREEIRFASEFEIDHELPAAEVWRLALWYGADGKLCPKSIGCASFVAWFNEKENLSIAPRSSNASKGKLMPRAWCPGSPGDRRALAASVRRTARRWRIPLSAADLAGLAAWERGECLKGQKVIGGAK